MTGESLTCVGVLSGRRHDGYPESTRQRVRIPRYASSIQRFLDIAKRQASASCCAGRAVIGSEWATRIRSIGSSTSRSRDSLSPLLGRVCIRTSDRPPVLGGSEWQWRELEGGESDWAQQSIAPPPAHRARHQPRRWAPKGCEPTVRHPEVERPLFVNASAPPQTRSAARSPRSCSG